MYFLRLMNPQTTCLPYHCQKWNELPYMKPHLFTSLYVVDIFTNSDELDDLLTPLPINDQNKQWYCCIGSHLTLSYSIEYYKEFSASIMGFCLFEIFFSLQISALFSLKYFIFCHSPSSPIMAKTQADYWCL